MEKLTIKDLIVVKQLPIIEEKLKNFSVEIDKKVDNAKSLAVSEETVKEVKKVRAGLNSEFKELETQRKLVKSKIEEPYKIFENTYKTYISEKYKSADTELKSKIDEVENVQKKAKEDEVRSYFNEYLESKNIDFVTFEQANINITLSASLKSLKEQAKMFIDKIVDDLKLIDMQDYKDEILFEYKKSLNVSDAIVEVKQRHIALDKAKEQEESDKELQKEIVVKSTDEPLKAPTEIDNAIYEIEFKVKGTKEELKTVKEFLESGGYEYEQC